LSTYGHFFQLINHGIAEEVIADVKRDMEKFFQLPLDKKNDYAQRPGKIEGYGQAFVFSDDQKLDWGDMFYFVSQPPQSRDISIWPNEPDTIRSDCLYQ
jgi:isopenicillin N synthase-like dioxygenase